MIKVQLFILCIWLLQARASASALRAFEQA
jgi:hypothetical protein